MRAQFILATTVQGIRRNVSMVVAVVLSVAVALVLGGGAVLTVKQANTLKDDWYDKVEVTVYLCTPYANRNCPHAVTDGEREQIEATIKSLDQVKQYWYETQAQAYQHFKQSFANQPDLVRNTKTDAIPASYRVKLKDPKKFPVVSSALEGMTGVDTVYDAHEALGRFFRTIDGIRTFGLLIALVVAIVSVLSILNTTRLAFFGRRREVGIMRLVGASSFYIQLPFLLESGLAGVVGAFLACGMLLGLRQVVFHRLADLPLFNTFVGTDAVWGLLPYGIVIGAGIAMITAWLTLLRYLRT